MKTKLILLSLIVVTMSIYSTLVWYIVAKSGLEFYYGLIIILFVGVFIYFYFLSKIIDLYKSVGNNKHLQVNK